MTGNRLPRALGAWRFCLRPVTLEAGALAGPAGASPGPGPPPVTAAQVQLLVDMAPKLRDLPVHTSPPLAHAGADAGMAAAIAYGCRGLVHPKPRSP